MQLTYYECSVRGCNKYCWYDPDKEPWAVTAGWLLAERGTKCPVHNKQRK